MMARRRERGVAAVFTVIAIAALLGVVGLALNVGYRYDTKAELQNAADSAALAGARELTGEIGTLDSVSTFARRFASRHTSGANVQVRNEDTDVQLGSWNVLSANPSFTPIAGRTPEDVWNINAVRVVTWRQEARSSGLPVWLGAFLGGMQTQDVGSEAVAVFGGPCEVGCPTVPFAFADCGFFDDWELRCGARLRMTGTLAPDPSDTVGFTSLSLDPASTSTYREILRADSCEQYALETGNQILVSNGAQLSAICALLRDRIGQKSLAPIVSTTCPNPRFNQPHQVIGFATFTIVEVVCNPASSAYVEFEFQCDETVEMGGQIGCGFFGTVATQAQLVR